VIFLIPKFPKPRFLVDLGIFNLGLIYSKKTSGGLS